jgi:hypothetical protein
MKLNRKGAVSLAAAVAVAAGAGAAFAATSQAGAAGYADTSLQATYVAQHTIAGTAAVTTDGPPDVAVSGLLGDEGGFGPGTDRHVVWALKSGSPLDGVTITATTVAAGFSDEGVLVATGRPLTGGADENGSVVLTATDTDGDVAVVTVPVTVGLNSVTYNLAGGGVLTDEIKTVTDVNENGPGSILFSATDNLNAAVSFTETNLPAGLASGNPLLPGSAIPGTYNDLAVQATDANGAVGTGAFLLKVNGGPAAVPVLSHGQAYYVSPVRENVAFESSLPTWVKFTITGPGPINGHVGWVYAQGDGVLNTAVYGGLEAKEGYKIIFQPYTGKNGSPVGHYGYVWFVTDKK